MVRSILRNVVSGPLSRRLRRFAIVGTVASGVQLLLLWLFVDVGGWHYLLAAAIAIELTIIFAYVLNNAWTFVGVKNTGRREYFVGLIKTNVIRGSAMPLQLGMLVVLVELAAIPYLIANAIAILLSGIYRYVLDARFTFGG